MQLIFAPIQAREEGCVGVMFSECSKFATTLQTEKSLMDATKGPFDKRFFVLLNLLNLNYSLTAKFFDVALRR